ncbi:MAG: DEAD/DEAH box helicase [Bacteroidetes bacterium]|nr:MAG: DEAD/DEAH box helicase [Bacteroidota bacterium]
MRLPEHIKLFSHQVETARFLIERDRAFVHNDIGTGKTLAAATALMNVLGDTGKALIVAPKSTLNHTWERTFYFHFKDVEVRVVTGTRNRRWSILDDDDVQVFIINPDALHIIQEHRRCSEFDVVLIDEHTYFKTARTRRYKALKKIVDQCGPRLWMMSGSPMPQAPTDIFAPMKLVCPDRLPRTSFTRFRDWSMFQVSTFKWVPKRGIEEQIAQLLDGVSIRFSRDECVDIPPAQFAQMSVSASAEQKKLEKQLENTAIALLEEGHTIDAANEAVLISKILQVASGAVKYVSKSGEESAHMVDCSDRLSALDDIIEASDGPVLVFSPYRAPMQVICEHLEAQKLQYKVVHGGVSLKAREEAFDAVQSRELDVLVAQPSAMSHGLTLTASNVVVWWGLPWSNETYEQATGRIIRVSQTRKQYIIHLVSSKYEEEVARRLQEKQRLQGTLLELLQERRSV